MSPKSFTQFNPRETLETPTKKPYNKEPNPLNRSETLTHLPFAQEVICSEKIDILRKKIANFDQAIQVAKVTSAKYFEVLVERYLNKCL